MRLPPRIALAAFGLILPACGYTTPEPQEPDTSGQTYAEALRVMCDVDKIGNIVVDDPFEAGARRSEVIRASVVNGDAIYFRTLISVKGPSDQAIELRKEAREAGLATCALADSLEKSEGGGIAP